MCRRGCACGRPPFLLRLLKLDALLPREEPRDLVGATAVSAVQ